ncbi:MAG: hypothetical protein D6731_25625 [Planctomycetota bacterium]|nr:MAG: hypothetical protein D6731_25625 [Planctomycetota bacterium]
MTALYPDSRRAARRKASPRCGPWPCPREPLRACAVCCYTSVRRGAGWKSRLPERGSPRTDPSTRGEDHGLPAGRGERHRVGHAKGGSSSDAEDGSDPDSADDEQQVGCATEHPFWGQGRGGVAAEDLEPGDPLLGSLGEQLVVTDREVRQEEADHFSFEVENWHTYFVCEAEAGSGGLGSQRLHPGQPVPRGGRSRPDVQALGEVPRT